MLLNKQNKLIDVKIMETSYNFLMDILIYN